MSENLFEDDTQTTTQPEMIAWPGGECPVAPRDLVMVEQRDGNRLTAEANTIAWNHLNVASDVMRWRMVGIATGRAKSSTGQPRSTATLRSARPIMPRRSVTLLPGGTLRVSPFTVRVSAVGASRVWVMRGKMAAAGPADKAGCAPRLLAP